MNPPQPSIPLRGRLLALDVGNRRVGVALADPSGMLASPLMTLEAQGPKADAARIAALCAQHQATGVVVGLPAHADGSESTSAARSRRYAAALQAAGLAVDFMDEWGSSVEAAQRLGQAGRATADKGQLDRVAAAIILQNYMDAHRTG